MAFSGFGKNSGPGGASRPEMPFGQFPRAPSPPHPLPAGNLHPSMWGDMKASSYKQHSSQTYQRPPNLHPQVSPSNSRNGAPAETKYMGRTGSPYSRSPDEPSNNPRGVINRHPFTSPERGSQLRPSNYNITPSPQKGISSMPTADVTYKSRPIIQSNHAIVMVSKQTISPTHPSISGVLPDRTMFHPHEHKRSVIDYRDLDAPEEMPSPSLPIERNLSGRDTSHSLGNEKPFTSSPAWTSRTNSSTDTTLQNPERISSSLTATGDKIPLTRNADVPLPKRTRSPTLSSVGRGFQQNPAINSDGNRRAPDFQSQSQSPTSSISNRIEIAVDSSMQFPAVKRTKIPIPSSSDVVLEDNLDLIQEEDRELQAKAKRLARFKDELSQPVQSDSIIRNQQVASKKHQLSHERQKFSQEPMVDAMGDSTGGDSFTDYEGVASSNLIVGLCPDMCPESERAERERKGDLDQYERLDGDRNLSSELLAVKKYTRTAEREAMLIRPMPILQKTMGYLLNLLSEPYDDRFLGLYNFLWDRMRAIRMDLRMQHIFNIEAIKMLEQMIRLHIIAMHELCEYTKGEGFSEGFDAHLNIEQMNKTSVELFQLYDDHRKRGIHVPSECEFRGYYALLKLDKHPGYKVEPAELSLDLAKMTPEIRQTPEVLFARDVARACRTGNFISFFRLANIASYLQACLMHAHFSKLRTQALASLHSGLQMNQGIPIAHVAKWLGMEEEDMGELLEYHGFSVKDFEEPYMMKENAFINADSDFPVRCSQLVHRKRSQMIADDVSNPSLSESYSAEKVPGIQIRNGPEVSISKTTPTIIPISSSQLHDEEMHFVGTISSPKGSMQMPSYNASVDLETPEENLVREEVQVAPASPFVFSFSSGSPASYQNKVELPQKPKYESVFRNSFGRTKKQDLDLTSPIIPDTAEEIRQHYVLPLHSVVHTTMSFTNDLQDEALTGTMEEDESDEVSSSYSVKEVAEARLKLILRIWKRRAIKKRELRERKQLAANTAMSLLPMGPPIWHFEAPSSNYGLFNIDHVMSTRHEIQERSWSVLNPSYVVAAKLVERNPDAECLCWKVVVCSQEEIPVEYNITQHNQSSISALSSWFLSKLMPANYNGDDDLLVLSPGLAVWRGWIPGQSDVGPICCLSVIKNMLFDDLDEAITGANAVLFPLLENIPLEVQKKRLHSLIVSLPNGARMPLLILSDLSEDELDPSSVAKDLGLHDIDKSTIIAYNIVFLKDKGKGKMDAFFSDERLREGLEWVASESPPQIAVSEIKIRDLVFHHLNSTLGILNETITRVVGPNNCIAAFNEALDRSMKDVAAAVDANPTGWPCPEINLLEQSSDECRVAAYYLPSTGWSSPSRTDSLMRTLDSSMLPPFEDDLSWLLTGLNVGDDFEDKKSHLENCLIDYLTTTCRIMGVALAQKEVMVMLQNCARLELHSSTYYIVPEWVSIFRRIFNWRLMNLTNGEVSSTYILKQNHPQCLLTLSSNFMDMESRDITFSPPYMARPSLDELVEVGRPEVLCIQPDLIQPYDASQACPTANIDVPASNTSAISMENEGRSTKNHSTAEENIGMDQEPPSTSKEADKLSELLEKCNIMQNLIDKKLSIFF